MSCRPLPEIPVPDLSLILPALPDISIEAPSLELTLCCTLPLPPIPPIVVPLGLIPGVAVILAPVMTTIKTAVKTINSVLSAIQVTCPNE